MLFIPAVLLKLTSAGISGAAYVLDSGPLYIAGMVLWCMWIALLFVIAMPQSDKWLRGTSKWLKPVSLGLAWILIIVGVVEFAAPAVIKGGDDGVFARLMQEQSHNLRYNDGTALVHQAADNLFDGENPYASANIVTATLRFGNPFEYLTPVRTGRFADSFPYPSDALLKQVWDDALQNPAQAPPEIESHLNYPAACFLLPAPLLAAGVGDLRWIYLGAVVLAMAAAVVLSPAGTRLWVLAGSLASLEIWQSVAAGETGSLAFPFLLLGWLLWKRNLWFSALCVGIACATKQTAWFFLPFYLILVCRSVGWKQACRAVALVGGVFLAFNIAFIAQSPGLWLESILSPLRGDFFPLGVGPVTLSMAGYIDVRTPVPFTIAEIAVGAGAIVWYWRNARRYPLTGVVLAVIPLFFAWRSAWWYFFYFDVILLAMVAWEVAGEKALRFSAPHHA